MSEILNPTGPYSIVAMHGPVIAIGGVRAYGEDLSRFGFLMNVAFEITDQGVDAERSPEAKLGYDMLNSKQKVFNARLDDTLEPDILERMLPEVHRAVGLLRDAHRAGHACLVTCAAGRNRSGLVVAEYLINEGLSSTGVIAAIQERRANALTNPLFVKWLQRRSKARRASAR